MRVYYSPKLCRTTILSGLSLSSLTLSLGLLKTPFVFCCMRLFRFLFSVKFNVSYSFCFPFTTLLFPFYSTKYILALLNIPFKTFLCPHFGRRVQRTPFIPRVFLLKICRSLTFSFRAQTTRMVPYMSIIKLFRVTALHNEHQNGSCPFYIPSGAS